MDPLPFLQYSPRTSKRRAPSLSLSRAHARSSTGAGRRRAPAWGPGQERAGGQESTGAVLRAEAAGVSGQESSGAGPRVEVAGEAPAQGGAAGGGGQRGVGEQRRFAAGGDAAMRGYDLQLINPKKKTRLGPSPTRPRPPSRPNPAASPPLPRRQSPPYR